MFRSSVAFGCKKSLDLQSTKLVGIILVRDFMRNVQHFPQKAYHGSQKSEILINWYWPTNNAFLERLRFCLHFIFKLRTKKPKQPAGYGKMFRFNGLIYGLTHYTHIRDMKWNSFVIVTYSEDNLSCSILLFVIVVFLDLLGNHFFRFSRWRHWSNKSHLFDERFTIKYYLWNLDD